MRHQTFITLFSIISFFAKSQIKTGNYLVRSDSSKIAVYLEIDSNYKFAYFDCRSSSTWLWGMTYGNWSVKNDTLILTYEHPQIRDKNDITSKPVKYTYYDGKIYTVTNGKINIETKKYSVRNNSLLLINDEENNKVKDWGNFDFILENQTDKSLQ